MEKKLNARLQHKIDIQANWEKATNFIPLKGEWIIYDKDSENSNIRLKIGDGTNFVNDLPFLSFGGDGNNEDISWNDLLDKPFYENSLEIDWDEETYLDILPYNPTLGATFYKVSNEAPTELEILGAICSYRDESEADPVVVTQEITSNMIVYSDDNPDIYMIFNESYWGLMGIAKAAGTCSVLGGAATFTFTSPGIWFVDANNYTTLGLKLKPEVKTLDEKFIPDLYIKKTAAGAPNGVAALDANGKINPEQIPGGTGGGIQLQVDYEQNDSSEVDYIKNRPFYEGPPKYQMVQEMTDAAFDITWDGNCEGKKIFTNSFFESLNFSWYKVSDNFIPYENYLNAFIYLAGDNFDTNFEEGYILNSDMLTATTIYQDEKAVINQYVISVSEPFSTTVDLGEGPIFINLEESGTYFLSQINDSGVLDIYVCEFLSSFNITQTENDVILNDVMGPGSILILRKVSDETPAISEFSKGLASYNNFNYSNGELLRNWVQGSELLELTTSFDDGSYAILSDGVPLGACIIEPNTTILDGLLTFSTPGFYLAYVTDSLSESKTTEVIIRSVISAKELKSIDPKFLPDTLIQTDSNGKIPLDILPDKIVTTDSTGKVPSSLLPEIEIPEQIQSDWEEKDDTNSAYIKNKPFGEQGIEIIWDGETVLDQIDATDTLGVVMYRFSDIVIDESILLGGTMLYRTDGSEQEYSFTIESSHIIPTDNGLARVIMRDGTPYFSFALGTGTDTFNGVSFNFNSGVYSIPTDEIPFGFRTADYGIKQLDDKYQKQSDWNENDSSLSTYIENRTHYFIQKFDSITWNGSTSGLTVASLLNGSSQQGEDAGYRYYKIAELPDKEILYSDFIGAEIKYTTSSNYEQMFSNFFVPENYIYYNSKAIFIGYSIYGIVYVLEDNAHIYLYDEIANSSGEALGLDGNITFPEKGIYAFRVYSSSSDYIQVKEFNPPKFYQTLDDNYLPNNIAKLTDGVLSIEQGGTGKSSYIDDTPLELRYRGSILTNSNYMNPTENGTIIWVYE